MLQTRASIATSGYGEDTATGSTFSVDSDDCRYGQGESLSDCIPVVGGTLEEMRNEAADNAMSLNRSLNPREDQSARRF